jgi:hypothetical protein
MGKSAINGGVPPTLTTVRYEFMGCNHSAAEKNQGDFPGNHHKWRFIARNIIRLTVNFPTKAIVGVASMMRRDLWATPMW